MKNGELFRIKLTINLANDIESAERYCCTTHILSDGFMCSACQTFGCNEYQEYGIIRTCK